MRKILTASAAFALFASTPAYAATVVDATGDFLSSYTGPQSADLDVTRFSAFYDPAAMHFLLQAQFAGIVDTATAGFYVIGVNTGTGLIDPFDSIGQGNVVFNQAIVIQKSGSANIGSATISGNRLSAVVPLTALPSTGFAPQNYGFNIWPRLVGGLDLISDFAPDNAMLSAVVPEPATWAMMVLGFGFVGGAVRAARRSPRVRVSYA